MHEPSFPPFDLERLLTSAFAPAPGERLTILIDFPDDPARVAGLGFLGDPGTELQELAVEVFYRGLLGGVAEKLGLGAVALYAYKETGGSNLDLPDEVYDLEGHPRRLEEALAQTDIVLCMGHHSGTAPLLAYARRLGFRGASMHNIDRTVLSTGLAVDYRDVTAQTYRIRDGISGADRAEVDFEVAGRPLRLSFELGGARAGTSCGKCRERVPNIENLPDGEVYLVPQSCRGEFPLTCDDGTVGILRVEDGRVVGGELAVGDAAALEPWLSRFREDPATGVVCELGFGTQRFPYSGRGIQDEKILGTLHIATGRSDHLGGDLKPDRFQRPENATHDDHLFNPRCSPAVRLKQVRLERGGEWQVLIEDYQPAPYLARLADGA